MTLKYSSSKYTFVIMTLLVLIAIYMQYSINQSTEALKTSEIKKAKQYALKITDYIKHNSCKPLSSCLDKHIEIRKNINHMLQSFRTDDFRNLFVLYKDKKNIFRFLLDGAEEDPLQYKTIFFPESKEFQNIYQSREPKIIEQKGTVEAVWMSLLYPIVRDDQVEGLLILDLSETYGEHIKNFNSPIQNTILLLQAFTFLSILFLGYTLYSSHQLRKSVLLDPLTSAYTMLYRNEYFEEHTINQYNFILLDIDKFKRINDRYGREHADRILREFVAYIKSILPNDTQIIRNHGTEFLLIMPKSSMDFNALSYELFESISTKRYLADNALVSFTVSMCSAIIPKEICSFYEIQHAMDEKLLEIKSTGKNRLIIMDELSYIDLKYKNIDNIKQAIDSQNLLCLYQPICVTKTKKISRYEALVRIVDEDDPTQLVSPYTFIELIKETIHYIRLSKWVIENTFKVLKENPDQEISINIDLLDLYNEELMALIRKELYNNKELANRLTFEILEHNEITDYERVSLIFKQLKSFGSKIAIDDFGSGYANFAYLAKLDIDIIKIDASLVKALEGNNERAISIIKLIHDLGSANHIDIVAEHVSSEELYMILKKLGIEYVQGYYLGKPQSWEAYHGSDQLL